MSSALPELAPVYETIPNEGALLKVWHQGTGPLLILIQGGGGDGARFNASIPALSQHYRVATYDRRGNGGSSVTTPRTLSPVESARDVIAIVKHLGYTQAYLFGTSSGGTIALQAAESYAEHVAGVVVHEIPMSSILPEETVKRMDAAYRTHQTYLERGADAALLVFRASLADKEVKEKDLPTKITRATERVLQPHKLDYFFAHEFLVFIIYTPNLLRIRESAVPIATVEGSESKGVFHATAMPVLAEILHCEHVVWPGAHVPFVEDPKGFAEELHGTILKLEKRS